MGGRRRFLGTTLAALAVLVLIAGIAAGVWVAASDEDEAPTGVVSVPEREEPDPAGESAPEEDAPPADTTPRESPESSPESPSPETTPPASPESSPGGSAPGEPNTTRFPRERREDPDRRGKRFSVPPAHEFTGTGNALIGTVDVRKQAVVRWRARGRFGLEFGQEAFPIVAPSRSGQLVVPPFRFELVRVLARGPWTITVTPQS